MDVVIALIAYYYVWKCTTHGRREREPLFTPGLHFSVQGCAAAAVQGCAPRVDDVSSGKQTSAGIYRKVHSAVAPSAMRPRTHG